MENYFIHKDNGQTGPFTLIELKNQNITKETLIWKQGLANWLKAGELQELESLFSGTPPPLPESVNIKQKPKFLNIKNKYVSISILGTLLLTALAIFIFHNRSEVPDKSLMLSDLSTAAHTAKKDTSSVHPKKDPVKNDSTKNVKLDTMSLSINWDSANVKKTEMTTNEDSNSTLPFFNTTKKKNNNKKDGVNIKKQSKIHRKADIQIPNDVNEQNTIKPNDVDIANTLSIKGTFRKNILFETVLEGIISNNGSRGAHEIEIKAAFIDQNGQVLDTHFFTVSNQLPAQQKVNFKFKIRAPKGTKNVLYSIQKAI